MAEIKEEDVVADMVVGMKADVVVVVVLVDVVTNAEKRNLDE